MIHRYPASRRSPLSGIGAFYEEVLTMKPTSVGPLNRAIALGMADGPDAGVASVEHIATHAALRDYLPLS